MVFSSITFLLYYLPCVLLLYYITPKPFKNALLLIASIFFYWWGAPKFIYVILGTTLLDFLLVQQMAKSENAKTRKLLLILSLSINLSLLFYFKYSNFFIDNLNVLLQSVGIESIYWTKLILPIGISFYTFESITYVVDVYRKVHKPLYNFWDYQLYIVFFPKLIAGPIVRFHEIGDQISDRSSQENDENRLLGFYRFCLGLAKKVLVANQLAPLVDIVFESNISELGTQEAWFGILAFSFQLYFDFSGYSDMAIGLAKMFGFKLPENFNNPYTSQSITDFWRRWHITLGSWMKNYLYIPLGGNKVNSQRLYLNLALVFIASGLWHGATWSFILWGAYHGLFIVLERLFLLDLYKKIGKLPRVLLTFFIVVIGWVFFKVEKLSDAFIFIQHLFSFDKLKTAGFDFQFYFYFFIAVFFAFFTLSKRGEKIQLSVYGDHYNNSKHISMTIISTILFVLCVSYIAAAEFNPFIYFRF